MGSKKNRNLERLFEVLRVKNLMESTACLVKTQSDRIRLTTTERHALRRGGRHRTQAPAKDQAEAVGFPHGRGVITSAAVRIYKTYRDLAIGTGPRDSFDRISAG